MFDYVQQSRCERPSRHFHRPQVIANNSVEPPASRNGTPASPCNRLRVGLVSDLRSGQCCQAAFDVYCARMQGQGSRQTRALMTWAGMIVAVIAAGSNYSVAQTQRPGEPNDQTALAMPRMGLRGAAAVGLPQPLTPSEATQVRRIFSLQDAGSVAEAARETERLPGDLLLGAILADRYLRGHGTQAELAGWLTRFGDQPEAPAIRGLLERLAPARPRRRQIPRQRRAAVRAMSRATRARCSCRTAMPLRWLLRNGHRRSPRPAAGRPGRGAARPGRHGGRAVRRRLSHRLHDHDASAGAFWAGRVALRAGDRGGFATWMRRAALEGDTFYGMIARRALGTATACAVGETIGNADLEALLDTPQGRRAFALLQVGERRWPRPNCAPLGRHRAGRAVRPADRADRARRGLTSWPPRSSRTACRARRRRRSMRLRPAERLRGGSAAGLCAGAP